MSRPLENVSQAVPHPTRVLITGGTRGIGLETTKQLLESGCEVVVVGRNFTGDFQEQGIHRNPSVIPLGYDLENIERLPELIQAISEEFPIDALVNNAGIIVGDREKVLRINFEAAQKLTEGLIESNPIKVVVNVGSEAGNFEQPEKGYLPNPAYAESKSLLKKWGDEKAKEWRERGIIVVTLTPGFVEGTQIFDQSDERIKSFWLRRLSPEKRYLTSQEVAREITEIVLRETREISKEVSQEPHLPLR